LFYNARKNELKLFFLDDQGHQEFSKRLPTGGFILPAPEPNDTFVTIPGRLLQSLFRA